MNRLIPILVTALSIAASLMLLSARAGTRDPQATPGFAVVELFTSEGCSSCPPADAALAELVRDSRGTRVYALAFHVDHWDYLGWADPFADKAHSARQREYAKAFKLDGLYTPQVVVNGGKEFVGSNRVALKGAVADAIATPQGGAISASASSDEDALTVTAETTDLPVGTIVNVALVEATVSRDVARGENGGRTLVHANVVRSFCSATVPKGGRVSVRLPVGKKERPDRGSIIVYAQRPVDLRVLAAGEIPLPR